MDRAEARSLLFLVNDPEVLALITGYVEARKKVLYNQLFSERNEIELRFVQGRIQELERMKSIKDEIIKAAE